MVRFLHTADWQLGMTRRYLGAEAQPRFAAARVQAVRTIGALAVAERCEFVVVCGDVFETNQVERQVVVRALDAMAATPSVRFYLLPGNHDPFDAASVFRSPTFREHCPPNVVVLSGPEPVTVRPGVEIVPAPWLSKNPTADLVNESVRGLAADGTVRVVVGHGPVDFLTPDDADPTQIRVAELETPLAERSIHYVALGDRHSTFEVGSSGRIWYSGSPEPTDFRETDPGNVLVVQVDSEVSVRSHRVGTWQFAKHEAHLTGEADLDGLHAHLEGMAGKDRTIVRLGLVGQLSLGEKARLDAILAHHADLFAAIEGWERRIDLVVLPSDSDYGELELKGFAGEAVADLRDQVAAGGPPALVAQDALALLFRLKGSAS